MSEKLKKPKKLIEIVDFGINDNNFACNAVEELLE